MHGVGCRSMLINGRRNARGAKHSPHRGLADFADNLAGSLKGLKDTKTNINTTVCKNLNPLISSTEGVSQVVIGARI